MTNRYKSSDGGAFCSDIGAIVQLQYGIEGFVPKRHLAKEVGKEIQADETAQFVVIEFDRKDKRIVLSHTRIWEQAAVEVEQAERKEKKAEVESTQKAVKNIQAKVEKTTLGDLSVLAELKKKLDEGNAE